MFDKPVMIITGTRKSIGKYLAEYYANKEFQVVGCSRGDIDFELDNYQHYCLDVSDDVLINNAGIASMNHVLLTPLKEVHDILNTNFVGTFLCCREAVKLMKRNKSGRIVNISSIHVPLATVGTSIYGASKASIEQFSRILAREVFQFGININILALSVVKSSGMADVLSDDITLKILERTISKTQLDFKDVSNAIDFLISPKSSMVTNQTLYLGGV